MPEEPGGSEARVGSELVAIATERSSFICRATRVDGWWAISVGGLPGAHTQARRLDEAEAAARDMLSLLFDRTPDSFDVTVSAELSREERDALDRIAEARERYEVAKSEVAIAQRSALSLLVDQEGLTIRDAGVIMSVSYQRIAQLTGQVD